MFLAQTLSDLIPQADVYHEGGENSRLINIFTNAHMAGFLPQEVPVWAWKQAIVGKLNSALNRKRYYIDANNHLYAFVSQQPELFPGLRVIHIVRDPRTYVRSHINWARHRLKSFIANNLIPFWQPNPFLMKEMSFFEWVKSSKFERFVWIWDYKNRLIERISQTEVPYLRIRFEDIFHTSVPEKYFNRVLEFLDLPPTDDLSKYLRNSINPNRRYSFPAWPKWSNERSRRLDTLCRETMKKYGYGNEPSWMEKINIHPEN